jgi:hypothetical protein
MESIDKAIHGVVSKSSIQSIIRAIFQQPSTGFANVIFLSSIRIGPGIHEIEGSRSEIRRVLRFVFSPVPIQVVSGRQKTLQRILP